MVMTIEAPLRDIMPVGSVPRSSRPTLPDLVLVLLRTLTASSSVSARNGNWDSSSS